MSLQLKDLSKNELLSPGHSLCAGCGPGVAIRMALKATRGPTVVSNATGCVEVATTIFPYTSWRIPYVHTLFENAAATASGIEAGFKALLKQNKIKKPVDVLAIGGDGGTFDIGMQALSGALERGHDFVYLCYDNEAYMNTGIQRSGATPRGASTTTSPAGSVIPGKRGFKKDLIGICAAHGIDYAATASIGYPNDYIAKVRKAIEVEGPAVVHVLAPCPLGWGSDPSQTIEIAKLAVRTTTFPLYEVEKGEYKLSMKIRKPLPVETYLKTQRRFRHLFRPGREAEIEAIRQNVDANWKRVLKLCGELS
ncbi:MAG: pyruvate ferredoxin oxidoreductase [Candidatus Bathyarchaeota archaeon]|nr:MAG: pyruvate ferredoxin oxidoreductase [Candidatus Bathyarchaeota archaeon]